MGDMAALLWRRLVTTPIVPRRGRRGEHRGRTQELQDSIEHPGRSRAQSGRRTA